MPVNTTTGEPTKRKSRSLLNKTEAPKFFGYLKKKQEVTKPGSLRFEFDSNLNRKVLVFMRPDKRGTNGVAAIDSRLLFRDNWRNRLGGGYFEFNEPMASTSTDRNRQESTKNVSSTYEREVVRPAANFFIVDLIAYDIAEKTIFYIQVNHMIEKPNIVNAKAEENRKKAHVNFIMNLKPLIHKTSGDPKLMLLKTCLRNNQK